MTNTTTQQPDSPPVESLHGSLRRRFDVMASRFQVVGRTLELLHPRSADDLIDEDSFERDDRLPYWAEIWASSLALAERIAGEVGHGRRLLELGCGVGLTAVVATGRLPCHGDRLLLRSAGVHAAEFSVQWPTGPRHAAARLAKVAG